MPDPTLLRTFRFQVKLRKSAGPGASASLSAGASFSASASLSAGASFSASASGALAGGASAGFRASVGAGAAAGEQLGDGGFQECSGLEVEMDVQEYLEGGRNDRVVRRVGRAKYTNIVLKRGMFYGGGAVNRDLWIWIQSVVSGVRPVPRYNGVIEVMGVSDDVVARWEFDRGLPAKIRGPELNARTGEIAIEELHIAHEGLRLATL
ncbi:phage tail protein [Sorangium sp. So ce854]|uniref:phage tail protein n=1 Tax=Sorangium sp. So ce854 TaxID=3133322 RepID=UPI003F6102AA